MPLQAAGLLIVYLLPIASWLQTVLFGFRAPGGEVSRRASRHYLNCGLAGASGQPSASPVRVLMTPNPMPRPGGAPPAPPRQPVFNAPPGVIWMTVTLVVFHALFNVLPAGWRYAALEWFAFVPAYFWAQFEGSGHFDLLSILSLVTHAFLHADLLHLFLNGGLLLAFGTLVERAAGKRFFLILFGLAAAGGAVAQALAVGAAPVVMVGASGAVYGMIGAAIPYLFAGRVGQSRRGALTFIAVIMGLNLVFGAFGLGEFLSGGGAIAWQAHIGGFVVGLALGALKRGRHGQT